MSLLNKPNKAMVSFYICTKCNNLHIYGPGKNILAINHVPLLAEYTSAYKCYGCQHIFKGTEVIHFYTFEIQLWRHINQNIDRYKRNIYYTRRMRSFYK